MSYESLITEVENEGIIFAEINLKGKSKGYYSDDAIVIDSKIETLAEKNAP